MPGNLRNLITAAEGRFSVRIRISLAPEGLGQRLTDTTAWSDENCGANGWAMRPSGMRGALNDALSIYFLDATLASPFVARWFAGYKVETAEGVLVQQDTARAPQTPDRPALGIGEAVIGTLPCVIQLLASRQRQPAIRLWIDILRVHRFPSI